MSRHRLVLSLLLVLPALSPGPTLGKTIRSFCAGARKPLSSDQALSAAAKAVFPNADYATRDDKCIYPLKMLRYGDADVLLAIGNTPGETCHGCGASLSAYVLRRTPARPVVVARFVDFSTQGTFGDPGKIEPFLLAGRDAFAVVSGGTFQGYSSTGVWFFVFKDRRLVALKPSLTLSADASGAMTDERKAVSVDGSWHVGPERQDTISFAYEITARGRKRHAGATWTVEGSTLKLTAGRVPPAVQAAGGN